MAPEQNRREVSAGTWAAGGAVVSVTRAEVREIAAGVRPGPGGSRRLLLHPGADDPLHEMLICHHRETYVRPHRTDKTSKTYTVLDGVFAMVLFDDDGAPREHVVLRDWDQGGPFLMRLMARCFHTLVVLSETASFIETLSGPFRGTEFAPWAPEADDGPEARAYFASLRRHIDGAV